MTMRCLGSRLAPDARTVTPACKRFQVSFNACPPFRTLRGSGSEAQLDMDHFVRRPTSAGGLAGRRGAAEGANALAELHFYANDLNYGGKVCR